MIVFDTWWHLSQGREILEHANLHRETLSFTAHNAQLFNHSWLFDALVYWVYTFSGYSALEILGWCIIALLFIESFLYTRTLGASIFGSSVSLVLTYITVRNHLVLRPQMISYLCAILMLGVLQDHNQKRRNLKISLIFCLWANMHGAFLLGLATLFGVTIVRAVEEQNRSTSITTTISSKDLFTTFLCALLGTLCTPFHLRIFQVAFENDPLRVGIHQYVNEWQPLSYAIFPAFYWILFSLVVIACCVRRSFIDKSILIAISILSLTSIRHLPFFGVMCVPIVISMIPYLKSAERRAPLRFGTPSCIFLGAAAFFVANIFVPYIDDTTYLNQPHIRATAPVQAAKWISEHSVKENILNAFENGGFLGFQWNGQPGIFVDSRIRPFRGKVLDDYTKIMDRASGWEDILKEYNIKYVILPAYNDLTTELSNNPAWHIINQEDGFFLFGIS